MAIPTNGNDGREMMSGVFDYVNMHPGWELQLINSRTDIASGAMETVARDAAGILLSIAYREEDIARELLASGVKMVVTNDHLVPLYADHPNCRTLLLDNVAIGRDAARYLMSLGHFASYGFVHGHTRFPWSAEREKGFLAGLPKNAPFFVYPAEAGGAASQFTAAIDQSDLAKWIEALPKPAAVFGSNDLFAAETITACSRLGIDVPQQISVIGCDNDPFIWSNTNPKLTSLQLAFRELGFKAAATLDALLRGRNPVHSTVRVAGTRLFVRASSSPLPPSTVLVENARAYIAEHACEGIRASDVVAHSKVSRSLLDLRFRQVCGKSVLEDILDTRLAEVRRQLVETDFTFLHIGEACGFKDPDNLKRHFRRRFGMSMREFRASSRSASASLESQDG